MKPTYNIAIIGANGGIGRQAVEIALSNGHYVTAIVRNPANIALSHPNLNIVQGDILQPQSIMAHLAGKDAVFSTIGKNSFKPTTLYSEGAHNLLAAMKAAHCHRAFFISASGLEVNPTHNFLVRFATKYILQRLLRHMYADLRSMETIVKKQADINWTIMRPPRLTDDAVTGKYRFSTDSLLHNALTISRADLAHFMITNIGNPDIYRKTVEVAY